MIKRILFLFSFFILTAYANTPSALNAIEKIKELRIKQINAAQTALTSKNIPAQVGNIGLPIACLLHLFIAQEYSSKPISTATHIAPYGVCWLLSFYLYLKAERNSNLAIIEANKYKYEADFLERKLKLI